MSFSSQCRDCANLRTGGCVAFPDGIPAVILRGEFDHRKAFPGDNGIRFKAKRRPNHPIKRKPQSAVDKLPL